MKTMRWITVLLCLLLLAGCAENEAQPQDAVAETEILEKTDLYELTRTEWMYTAKVFDRQGNVLYTCGPYPKQPRITEISDGLIKVSTQGGTGLSTQTSVFCNADTGAVSDRLTWVLAQTENIVVCGKKDELLIRDIFGYLDGSEPRFAYCVSYDRFADIADNVIEPVRAARFTEDGTALEVMYYAQKGSERVESTATVPLTDGTRQAIPTAVDATVQRTALTMDFVPPIAYTYDTLAAASDVVAVADVQDIADGDGSIVTACRTVDVLKGTVPETFWVADSGVIREADREGYEDLNEVRTECTMLAEPLMRRGNRVLLFLVDEGKVCEDGTPCYPLAVGPASKFFFDPTTSRYDNALWYSEVYQEQYEDGTVAVHYLMDTAPKTLEQIKERIRSNEE